MQKYQVPKLVFSSSETVYGDPEIFPITERSPLHATNPMVEELLIGNILRDIVVAKKISDLFAALL